MDLDMTVISMVVACLLVVVLVMQIQLNTVSKEIDEKQQSLNKKMDELLKEKGKK